MTFVLTKERVIRYPVSITLPNDKGVKTTSKFTGVFRLLTTAQWKDAQDAWTEDRRDLPQEERDRKDVAFVKTFMIGWEGVIDDARKPIEFSAGITTMVAYGPYQAAIINAYDEAISQEGQAGRRRGN